MKLTKLALAGLITTAFEGGSNHFIDLIEYPESVNLERFDSPAYADTRYYGKNYSINVKVEDEITLATLNDESVTKGWDRFCEHYPTRAASVLTEDYDAEDADIFLQFCLFGQLVYG